MPWLIVGGALAVWLLLQRSQSASAAVSVPQTTPGAAAGLAFSGIMGSKPPASTPPPSSGGVSGALSTVQNLSNAGCAKVASSKGIPPSYAATGCQIFGYLTPIGAASAALKYGPPALTYVGTKAAAGVVAGAKGVVAGVEATGNAITGGVSSAYHSIASFL